jgi:hypothetical protein
MTNPLVLKRLVSLKGTSRNSFPKNSPAAASGSQTAKSFLLFPVNGRRIVGRFGQAVEYILVRGRRYHVGFFKIKIRAPFAAPAQPVSSQGEGFFPP